MGAVCVKTPVFFSLVILMKNAFFAKYRLMFSKGRSMFSTDRWMTFSSKDRSMFSKDQSMFLTMDAGFINITKNQSFDTNGNP